MQELTSNHVRNLLDSGLLKLSAIQGEICWPIVHRIYKKMKIGINFDNIRVNGTRIVDGHHRYICSILAKVEIGMDEYPIPSTAVNFNWNDVAINEVDYENEEKIHEHNVRDAELNDVDISILNDL